MDYLVEMQQVLDKIDACITEKLSVKELADTAGFSSYHFCRIFQGVTGYPVMLYVARRKLQFALFDLCSGKKVVDVAMEYGFETHAGFTKAFKRCFGYPPSLYCLHADVRPPQKIELQTLKNKLSGGMMMHPQILELKPFTVVGYTSRYSLPDVKHTHDIPAWWDSINMEFSQPLTRLHHTFTNSRHCEYGVCFDADLETGGFTYMLGVGVDNGEDRAKIEPDLCAMELPGGLYAVFTTPLVPDEQYAASIRDTWKDILLGWLPASDYEYDESRKDFEYYDQRDHAWEHDNMVQMDIYIPVCKRI